MGFAADGLQPARPSGQLTVLQRSTVFEMLPMPAFIKSVDLAFTHANSAFCDLVGMHRDGILGRRSGEIGAADADWQEETDLRVLREGGMLSYPVTIRRGGQTPFLGEIFKIRLDDDQARAVGLLGVVVDRSYQADVERKLLEVEAIHRLVVESISDAVFLLDAERRFTFVGPNVKAIFGLDGGQLLTGRSIVDLLDGGAAGLAQLRHDRELRNAELVYDHPDGRRREFLVNVKPIEIGASRWLVTCHDVTERNDSLRRLKTAMAQTIKALSSTVEQRDPYVTGHQDRVADLAVAIGRRMGLDESRVEGLRLGAVVHDIGKINVPIQILSKPGRLSDAEFDLIRAHSEIGYQILKDIDFPWPIARMVREHHEAMDGSGYPLGLTGDQLLLESRILSVADVLEAVTSHRPYRPGLGLQKGIDILREMRGTKLDPEAVDICISLIESHEVEVPGWTSEESAASR